MSKNIEDLKKEIKLLRGINADSMRLLDYIQREGLPYHMKPGSYERKLETKMFELTAELLELKNNSQKS